jgi:hypothetical protein
MHTRKKSGTRPVDVDFGKWKTVVVRNHLLTQKRNALSFIKICQFSYHKVCDISVKSKALHKTSAPTSKLWNFFISNLCSFHFPFVAIILHLWLMKFSIWQDKRSRVCEHTYYMHLGWSPFTSPAFKTYEIFKLYVKIIRWASIILARVIRQSKIYPKFSIWDFVSSDGLQQR